MARRLLSIEQGLMILFIVWFAHTLCRSL